MVERICSLPDCDKPHYARGWCASHYYQWWKHGDPLAAMRRYRTPLTGNLADWNWRSVVGFEGVYEVSDGGHVRRIAGGPGARPGHILRTKLRSGYPAISLSSGGSPRRGRDHHVHSLVAAAFIGPCPAGYEVNHKNGIKTDNRRGNLEYVTKSENRLHAYRLGLTPLQARGGERNNAAKLTAHDVAEIRRRYKPRVYTAVRLAAEFGITAHHVHQLVRGKSWKETMVP